MADWHEEVYGRSPTEYIDNILSVLTYEKIRPQVLKRDGYRCRRCKIKPGARKLSAHHIIPRSERGPTVIENMITLCHPCHDYVELKGFRSIIEIETRDIDLPVLNDSSDVNRPLWHSWVYGGAPIPQRGR